MEWVIIAIAAFATSLVTFFSGFGLGTLLAPVFMIFFPVDVAIALTGIVHLANNLFKLTLTSAHAHWPTVWRFGIPAVLAAIPGAWLLIVLSHSSPLFSYEIAEHSFSVFPVKLLIAILLIVFSVMELIPYFNRLTFGKNLLPIGGVLSGFFGGLSGNQGALRTAFLIKAGLSKEAFIATAVVVSVGVDFTRIGLYFSRISKIPIAENYSLLIAATLSAIAGAYLGNLLLKKITLRFIQISVAVLLILLSLALALGWV